MQRLVKKAGICLASFALLACHATSPVKEYEVKKEYAINDYEVRFSKDSGPDSGIDAETRYSRSCQERA